MEIAKKNYRKYREFFYLIPLDDPKIRGVPIVTSNPTLFELNHIHHRLSTVEIEKLTENPAAQEDDEEDEDEQEIIGT